MNTKTRTILPWLGIAGAAVLTAFNYQIFILYNAFAPSGINGIATMFQYLFRFSLGYLSLMINIPLTALVYFKVDKAFAGKSFLYVLVFSCMLLFLQEKVDLSRFIYHTGDGRSTLLAPVAAGAVNGFIYGITMRLGGSTGGTDLVAAYFHKHHPEFSLVRIIFAFNCAVAGMSYFVYQYNIEPVILCIIYSFITSRVSDGILKGGEQALKVEIITSHKEEITRVLIERLKHSVTILRAEGGYTHQDRSMLICVINRHQVAKMTEILREFPDTFAYFSDVSRTVGNFRRIPR